MEIMNKADPLLVARLTKETDMKGDLREVAEQFEAIFINQFLAQSRKTKPPCMGDGESLQEHASARLRLRYLSGLLFLT